MEYKLLSMPNINTPSAYARRSELRTSTLRAPILGAPGVYPVGVMEGLPEAGCMLTLNDKDTIPLQKIWLLLTPIMILSMILRYE